VCDHGGVHRKFLHYAKLGYARNLANMPYDLGISIAKYAKRPR